MTETDERLCGEDAGLLKSFVGFIVGTTVQKSPDFCHVTFIVSVATHFG